MWLCKAVVIGEEKAERAHISPLSVSPELSHGIPTYFLWPRMNHMSPTWLQGNLGSVCSGRTGWTGLSDPVHLSLPQGRVILLRISFRSRRYHMFTQIFFVNILRALSCARSICIISFKPQTNSISSSLFIEEQLKSWGDYAMTILLVNGGVGTQALVQFGSSNSYSGSHKSTRIKAAGSR